MIDVYSCCQMRIVRRWFSFFESWEAIMPCRSISKCLTLSRQKVTSVRCISIRYQSSRRILHRFLLNARLNSWLKYGLAGSWMHLWPLLSVRSYHAPDDNTLQCTTKHSHLILIGCSFPTTDNERANCRGQKLLCVVFVNLSQSRGDHVALQNSNESSLAAPSSHERSCFTCLLNINCIQKQRWWNLNTVLCLLTT